MNVGLFTYTRQKLALSRVLTEFASLIGLRRATALLYSPNRCSLAIFARGSLYGPDSQPFDLGAVFEARVFGNAAEMRWLNDPGPAQRHQAVILSEQDCSGSLSGWQSTNPPTVIETLQQTYLLWGEATGQSFGSEWSELATARIGALLVPVANATQNQRVLLHSVEYLVEGEHGNAIIYDERLLELEVTDG